MGATESRPVYEGFDTLLTRLLHLRGEDFIRSLRHAFRANLAQSSYQEQREAVRLYLQWIPAHFADGLHARMTAPSTVSHACTDDGWVYAVATAMVGDMNERSRLYFAMISHGEPALIPVQLEEALSVLCRRCFGDGLHETWTSLVHMLVMHATPKDGPGTCTVDEFRTFLSEQPAALLLFDATLQCVHDPTTRHPIETLPHTPTHDSYYLPHFPPFSSS